MKLRNGALKRKKNNKKFVDVEAERFRLEGFQYIKESVDLSYSLKNSNNKEVQKVSTPNKRLASESRQPQYPIISGCLPHNKLRCYRHSLNQDFSSFLDSDLESTEVANSWEEGRGIEDWIIKAKAKQFVRNIYQREAISLEKDRSDLMRARERFKILQDLKRQKKIILSKFFSS